MNTNFEKSLAFTLKEEGGYSNDAHDPGGATMLGIIKTEWQNWVGHYVTNDDMRKLTVADVTPIYKQKYWDACKCDSLPSGVDACVFDFGVNSGISRSAKYLQRLVGVAQDGSIGPKTIEAVSKHDPNELIKNICDAREQFLRGLNTFQYFGKGWIGRVNRLRTFASTLTK